MMHLLNSTAYKRRAKGLVYLGSGVGNLNVDVIREYPIVIPPRHEQEAIEGALTDADSLIKSLEQLIVKKRQIRQGAMQELLTGEKRLPGFREEWETRRFDELFTVLRNASNSRSELTKDGEVAYVHYGDIHTHPSAFLNPLTKQTYISRQKVRTIPRLTDGDLLMADASEDTVAIGRAVEIVDLKGREAVAGLHTMLLRGDKDALVDGFKGYLQFLPSVRTALVRLATGVSVYGITKSGVKAIEITIPKPEEQTAIATILSDIDAEISALETKLAKARQIKQGMMQELLTGRTRLV
jgi:type I restriction enzyme S subunit